MLISRETDYALRILRALAGGERVATTELSKNEHIPQSFAYKIIKKLENANLINIFRGINGGSELACDLSKISLLDFMEIMGEHLHVNACLESGYECSWVKAHGDCVCHVHSSLIELQHKIKELFEQYSLQDILFEDKSEG